jgi:hypothetical protein
MLKIDEMRGDIEDWRIKLCVELKECPNKTPFGLKDEEFTTNQPASNERERITENGECEACPPNTVVSEDGRQCLS